MLDALNNTDYQPITINYKDQTVNLNPECSFTVTWSSGVGQLNLTKSTQHNHVNNLPKPNYTILTKNELTTRRDVSMPTFYVKYSDCEGENKANEIEYDLDREDLEWLKLVNEKRKEKGYNSIDDIVLEKAINLLEKESYFEHSKTGHESTHLLTDDDAPCCICNDAEDSNANQIIFCDMCNVAVHQECYGVPYIPEGQWLCRRCQFSPSVVVKCALCPFTTGAFKQTADGRWVHVICAIWINEVHFANTVFLEPVEGVDFALKRRKKLTCIVCKNRMGACLQCSHRSCARSFHVTCAFYAHVRMELKEMRTKKNPDTIAVNRFVYCHQHSQNGLNSEENVAAWKRDIQSKIIQARKRLNAETKKENMSVPIPVIPQNRISQLAATLSIEHFSDIIAYWSLKRQSRCGVPLIRRLQVYGQRKTIEGRPSKGLDDVSKVEDNSELNKQGTTPLMKMSLLRCEFERVRLLSELVKKREQLKKESLSYDEKLLSMITPVAVLIQRTLEKLIAKDHQEVFMHPVSEEDVPGYHKFIAHPMDFCQMIKKCELGQYKRVADLRTDFNLMMNNCAIFNRDNKYFYDYGQRIKQIGLKVIKTAEAEETRISQTLQIIETFINRFELFNSNYLNKLKFELKSKDENNKNNTEHSAKRRLDICEISINKKNNEKQQKTDNIVTENEIKNCSNNSNSLISEKKKQQRRRIVNGKGLNSSDDKKKKLLKEQKKQRKKSGKDVENDSLIILKEKPTTSSSTENLINGEEQQQSTSTPLPTTPPQPITPPKRSSTNRKCKISSALTPPSQSEQSNDVETKRIRIEETNTILNNSLDSCQDTKTCNNSIINSELIKINGNNNNKNFTQFTLNNVEQVKNNKTNLTEHTPIKTYKSIGRNRKKNFTYSYLTEASSAADEEDLFDIDEEEEEEKEEEEEEDSLPQINFINEGKDKNKKFLTKRLRKKIIKNGTNDEHYQHNDIVWARIEDGSQIPARVIDLRMRYEFEDNGGLGTNFVQQAIKCFNKEEEGNNNNKTLVILFDKTNTWRWISNNCLEPCSLLENDISQLNYNQTILDALKKAKQFWNNVLQL